MALEEGLWGLVGWDMVAWRGVGKDVVLVCAVMGCGGMLHPTTPTPMPLPPRPPPTPTTKELSTRNGHGHVDTSIRFFKIYSFTAHCSHTVVTLYSL